MHYFVSDLHLRDKSQEKYQMFIRFLQKIRNEKTESLFLLGDIFDLWVADHKCFIDTYQDVVNEIQTLVKSGVKVYYFEGNHDLYLKRFWQDTLGCKVYLNELYIPLDGLTFRIEHGDLANPNDKAYLMYRKTLRSQFFNWLAYRISGKLVQDWGLKASAESRKTSNQKRIDTEKILDTYVLQKYQEKPFDVFISGHFHVRLDKKVGSARNINLGWWDEEPMALQLDKGQISWLPVDR
jgi:UDP-2,3-diacylglucosamine hydrolase